MSASPESVSAEAAPSLKTARRILLVGVNWLGDSVMAMPALAGLRTSCPDAHLTLLVKKGLVSLWHLHPALNAVGEFGVGWGGTVGTARAVRAGGFDAAVILPHSFRAALVPWLARVPVRRGMPGHQRDWMLTECVPILASPEREHQAWEYMALLGRTCDALPEPPYLTVPVDLLEEALQRMARAAGAGAVPGTTTWIGLFPGASRGPSKRWPEEHFVALGRKLAAEANGQILVLGGAGEVDSCARIVRGIGPAAGSLAGQTSLAELAAVAARCAVVVANDSGGMHLAAAVGAPVVGIFGLTDPMRTGPLGRRTRVVRAEGVAGSRAIPRESERAESALRAIAPERVLRAAMELLREFGAR